VGRIRLEAFQHNFTGSSSPAPRAVAPGTIILSNVVANSPKVRVVSVAGIPVPEQPLGLFTITDVDVTVPEGTTDAEVIIAAENIPLGASPTITLRVVLETGGLRTPPVSLDSGTDESSTWTATVDLPHGFSRFYVEARWDSGQP